MRLPRSLTSRLVLTTVGLVALVSILIAAATTLAMRDYLTHQLDEKIFAAADRAVPPPEPGSPDGHLPRGAGGPGFGNQEPGTIVIFLNDEDGGFIVADRRGDEENLSLNAAALLEDIPSDGEAHEVDVPGYGTYRIAVDDQAGVVTGLPVDDLDQTVESLIQWELALGALAVLLSLIHI